MDKSIVLKDIDFSYPNGVGVFRGFNFKYRTNSKIGIIGSNGSGKSTLFKLIMGLVKPDAGSIEIFGNSMRGEKDFSKIRTRIGLVLQNPEDQILFPNVAQDIAFGPLNQGKTRKEAESIVENVIKELDLQKYEDSNPFKLSGGEKHLVALAGVAAMNPDILLLDEPFEWLDSGHRNAVSGYLRKQSSYILISQDKNILNELCPDGIVKL